MFSQQELDARIKKANAEMVTGEEVPNAPPDPNAKPVEQRVIGTGKDPAEWVPIDIHRNNQRKQMAMAQKEFPRGSRALVMAAVKDIIDGEGGLATQKKKAENDIEALLASGYKDRAEIKARQYVEEKFLPAIEVVIDYTSPDELLNCKEALAALDKMMVGVGSKSGYTAAYVRQAYGDLLGKMRGGSDPAVAEGIRRIKQLVGEDQMRTAIGMAQRLKTKVDNGEAMAEPEDYAILGRIVSYAN